MQPYVIAAQRDEPKPIRSYVAQHRQHQIQDTTDDAVVARAFEVARRQQPPDTKAEMHAVVNQVNGEKTEDLLRHLGISLHAAAGSNESDDSQQQEHDSENLRQALYRRHSIPPR